MQSPALGPPPKKRADGIILAGALFAPVSFCAIWLFAAGATRLLGSLESALALTAGFVAYLFSGHSSIYSAQRIGIHKRSRGGPVGEVPLRELH